MNKWIITLALCILPISVYAVDQLGSEPTQDIAKKGGGGHHSGGHHGGGHGGGHHSGHHGGHHGYHGGGWDGGYGWGWGIGPSVTFGNPYWYSGYDNGYYYAPYATDSTYYYYSTPSDDSTYYYYYPQ